MEYRRIGLSSAELVLRKCLELSAIVSDSDPRLQLQAAQKQQVAEPRGGSASESASENKTRAELDQYRATTRQPLEMTGFATHGCSDTPKVTRGFISSDKKVRSYETAFHPLPSQGGRRYYVEDTETRKQESLGTSDRADLR